MNDAARTSPASRRELARKVRDGFPPMGIYAVRDAASGRALVRASRNVHASLNRMRFELRMGAHADKGLQEAWRRDPASLSFDVLELVPERTDPAFDYDAELAALEDMHRELALAGGAGDQAPTTGSCAVHASSASSRSSIV